MGDRMPNEAVRVQPAGGAVRLQPASVRAGHGILFTLPLQRRPENGGTLALDVAGPVFQHAGAAATSLANWMLPLALHPMYGIDGECSFVLGAKQLSHARVESELAKMIAAGDPNFVIELLRLSSDRTQGATVLRRVATRASLLQTAWLANSPAAPRIDLPDVPLDLHRAADARRKPGPVVTTARWVRWWLLPLLFCAGAWLLLSNETSWLESNLAGQHQALLLKP